MALVDDALLSESATVFDATFQQAYEDAKPEVNFEAFTMMTASSGRKNKYPILSKVPGLRRWLGERVWHSFSRFAMELVNEDFEDGIEVDVNDIEDDQLGGYGDAWGQLGFQAKLWPQDLALEKLAAGETEESWDGQGFFDTDHPVNPDNAALGTYSNLKTASALTSDNYEARRAEFSQILGPDGRPIAVRPKCLVVPTQLEGKAKRIVEAETVSGGDTNVNKGTTQVITVPQFTDATSWYLMGDLGKLKPLLFQLRKAPYTQALDRADSANVIEKRKARFGIHARGAAAFAIPWLAMKMKA